MSENKDLISKNPLKWGNDYLKNGDFEEAKHCYALAIACMPELKHIIEKNLLLVSKEESFVENRDKKFAVVVHCFYLDIWIEIRTLLLKISSSFDLFVTMPDGSSVAEQEITNFFPRARIIKTPNIGMDIVPFLSIIPLLLRENYYAICKIQTKKGDGPLAVLWRRLMLDSLIGSTENFDLVTNAFRSNSELGLVGAGAIYQSAHRLMYENKQNIEEILSAVYSSHIPEEDWGFFAGTMFWVKTELLISLSDYITRIPSRFDSAYKKDGKTEHALERIFGLIPRLHNKKIALLQPKDIYSKKCELILLHDKEGIGVAHIGDVMYQLSRLEKDHKTISSSNLFNKEYYKRQNPEIKDKNIDLIAHYLTQGFFSKKHPFKGFSFSDEMTFLLRHKGGTRNSFVFYLENNGDLEKIKKSLGVNYSKKACIFDCAFVEKSNLFDFSYYKEQLSKSGIQLKKYDNSNLIEHYLKEGNYLEIYPNKWFIPREYRTLNKDSVDQDFEPFFHYLKYGAIENRRYRENILREKDESPFFRYMVLNEVNIDWHQQLNKKRKSDLVSIVIPIYNQPALTEQCLESLLAAQSHIHSEIICVDNGSDIDTKSVIQKISKKSSRIKIVTHTENLNFSLGCNTGFKESDGHIVVFLNNDTIVTDFWLDNLICPLSDEKIAAVQPTLLYPDNTIQNIGIVFNTRQTLGYPIYAGIKSEFIATHSRAYQAVTGACMAVRAHDFAAIRGFDPLFINGQEDVDLCLRLTQSSKRTCWYQSSSLVFHHESKTSGRGRYIKLNRRNFVDRWHKHIKADDTDFYKLDGFFIKDWHLDSEEMISSGLAINRPIVEKEAPPQTQVVTTLSNQKKVIRIKISCPNLKTSAEWGDYHFACSMKRAFEKRNFLCHVDCKDVWYTPESSKADIIIVLRGLYPYKPITSQFNIIWNISHPDKISLDEYNSYDHIFIASKKHTETIKRKTHRPVTCLLQCTDHELFNLNVKKEKSYPILFVGNSRDVFRPIVKAAISESLPLAVFGTRWNQFIPEHYIKGQNIDNKKLAGFYAAAGVVLNDHWASMAEYGFISNRLFDAVASGAYVISDYVEGIEEIFHDSVIFYSQENCFYHLNKKVQSYNFEKKIFHSNLIIKKHTFHERTDFIISKIKIN